jgi:hypothetical protein
MNSLPIHSLMAREATRSKLTRPQPEPRGPRRPRRAAARVLQSAAHRLDPCVATAPARAVIGR